MAAGVYILDERDRWGTPLVISVALHGLIALVVIFAAISRGLPGQVWGTMGAGGGAMNATIVRSLPLPQQQTENTNVLANESKGLGQSQPKAEQQAVDSNALEIASKNAKTKKTDRTSDNNKPQPQAAANQVPFGRGGPANNVQFSMGAGTGGLNVEGTGDFAGRYGWYVEQVRNKIAQNWSFYQLDPNVPKGARVTISFEITRNGQPSNISMKEPSAYSSLNDSAVSTLKRVDTFGPLPGDYRGSTVRVDFYFER
jgi:protein TonB